MSGAPSSSLDLPGSAGPSGSAASAAPRLRIAFVYDALYPHLKGGAERRNFELATRLAVRHDVHMVSWSFPDASGREVQLPAAPDRDAGPAQGAITLHGTGPAPDFYGDDGQRRIGEAVAFARSLVPVLLRERFDVIDCSATPYVPVFGCLLAARLTRTPMIVTWHEHWGGYWSEYLAERPMAARIARLVEAACRPIGDLAVAVSPFTAERLARPGTVIVPNGVPIAEIDAAPPVADAAEILFAGRLIAEKKVDELLCAVARIRWSHPGLRCDIVGDGPERGRLEALTRTIGLEGSVRFLGRIDTAELFGRMRAATAFVLPSVREGYGIVVVEAMAAGAVPVVARGPLTAASALVRDGEDGLICDPEAESIACALGSLLDHPALRARMRAAARASAEGRDWDRAAEALEAACLDVVRSKGRRRVPAVASPLPAELRP